MLRRSVGVLFCCLIEENFRQFCGDVPPLIGHTPVSSAAKSSLCWQTLAKRSDRISRVTLLIKLPIRPTNWAAVYIYSQVTNIPHPFSVSPRVATTHPP